MIVYGFADSINWAMNTLTGDNYRMLNHTGYWVPQRNAVQSPVSGASGAFDFYKSNNFPNQPVTTQANGLLFHTSQVNAYTVARTLVDSLGITSRYTANRSRLWFVKPESYIQHIPPTKGQVTYYVTGTIYRSGNPTQARVYAVQGGNYVAWGATNINGDYVIAVPPGAYVMTAEEWIDFPIGGVYYPTGTYYTGTANATVTNAHVIGVNIDITSGSATFPYRWGWAKCLSARVIPAQGTVSWAPIETEFSLSEGVLYGVLSAKSKIQGDSMPFDMATSGTYRAPLRIELQNGAGNITAFSLTNNTTGHAVSWSGTLTTGKYLLIDANAYKCLSNGATVDAGTDDYASLTTNALPWISVYGTQSFTIAVTQSGAANWAANIYYYDHYSL